ncbi:MAG TPA: hypothetical protein VL307_15415, partial [Chitinophagaceae bacterium]|nr:hypothetical protein [Chitinophagaceae bacterium]
MKHFFLLAGAIWLGTWGASAQNYHAIQGSSYAGALGVHNNPASIVSTPFKWDVVLFATQLKSSTNAFTIYDYSLLSSPANSLYQLDKGKYKRQALLNFNLNILNARIALNKKSSLAFGINLRSHSRVNTSEYNFIDTLNNATDFLKLNPDINQVSGKLESSSWMEGYISYARTLWDNEASRLNAGITVRVSRGISGAYVNAENVRFTQSIQNNRTVYNITGANMIYGYSANYDHWLSSNSTGQNIKNIINKADGGASFDLGIEYLIKPQGTSSFNDEEDYYDYDWKVGLSLLDIGGNQYRYGTQSRVIYSVKDNITGASLDNKFVGVNSVKEFNDSLATVINGNQAGGKFTVLNPMRFVANIDHYLTGNFYINGELSVNIPASSIKKTYLQVKEFNLLTITPRWETKRFGFYLPVQFNTRSQFWVGGAFKAGPLLLGFHNLVNLFGKKST